MEGKYGCTKSQPSTYLKNVVNEASEVLSCPAAAPATAIVSTTAATASVSSTTRRFQSMSVAAAQREAMTASISAKMTIIAIIAAVTRMNAYTLG